MQSLFDFIKTLYPNDFVPLHEPVFIGNESEYVQQCIDSSFVSSVGKYVVHFEEMMKDITGAKHAVAVVNGTCGLQIALECAGLKRDEEVITQSLTFVGTANAISHAGGTPVFVDVDKNTLGMCPQSLEQWLEKNTTQSNNQCININTNNVVKAVMPVHVFGNPCAINEICTIAQKYNLFVIEDSAESLGSYRDGKHTGTFGKAGVFSFNGNKIVTAGGGGGIVTDDEDFAMRAKHMTTTAKLPHPYEFFHNEVGYNYRLTNIAAALACAQLEKLDDFIKVKEKVSNRYHDYFLDNEKWHFIPCPVNCKRNNWLNAFVAESLEERNIILDTALEKNIQLRPIWTLISDLPMYKNCQKSDLTNSMDLSNRIINLPSSANAKVV